MSTDDHSKRFRIAIHEAGHAVMAHLRGMKVKEITMDSEDESEPGYTVWDSLDLCFRDGRKKQDTTVRRILYMNLLVIWAGAKAEHLVFGLVTTGFEGDLKLALEILKQLYGEENHKARVAYEVRLEKATERILKPHIEIVWAIADRLLRSGPIFHEEFVTIMKGFGQ